MTKLMLVDEDIIDDDREPKEGTDEWYAWDWERREAIKEYEEAMRYQMYCENKYGWDCS